MTDADLIRHEAEAYIYSFPMVLKLNSCGSS